MVADAALVTGLSLASLGYLAYMAPSEAYLNWAGPLAFANVAITMAAGLSIARPGSYALYNIWLYGGVTLAGLMAMWNTQRIIKAAKSEEDYEPLSHAMDMYLNAVMMFVYILKIMAALAEAAANSESK